MFSFFLLAFLIHSDKRHDFQRRRKLHYNEFEAVRRARQLMEEDGDEDDENVEHDRCASENNDDNVDMEDGANNTSASSTTRL